MVEIVMINNGGDSYGESMSIYCNTQKGKKFHSEHLPSHSLLLTCDFPYCPTFTWKSSLFSVSYIAHNGIRLVHLYLKRLKQQRFNPLSASTALSLTHPVHASQTDPLPKLQLSYQNSRNSELESKVHPTAFSFYL